MLFRSLSPGIAPRGGEDARGIFQDQRLEAGSVAFQHRGNQFGFSPFHAASVPEKCAEAKIKSSGRRGGTGSGSGDPQRGFNFSGKLCKVGDDFLRLLAHDAHPPFPVFGLELQGPQRERDEAQFAVHIVAQGGKLLVQFPDLLHAERDGFGW